MRGVHEGWPWCASASQRNRLQYIVLHSIATVVGASLPTSRALSRLKGAWRAMICYAMPWSAVVCMLWCAVLSYYVLCYDVLYCAAICFTLLCCDVLCLAVQLQALLEQYLVTVQVPTLRTFIRTYRMPSGNCVCTAPVGMSCIIRQVTVGCAACPQPSVAVEEMSGKEKCGRSTDSQHTAHHTTLCLSSKIFSVWIQVNLAHCRCDLSHQLTDINGIRYVQALVSTSVPLGEVMEVSVRTRSIYEQLNECSAARNWADYCWTLGGISCHMKWAGLVSIGATMLLQID